MALRIQNQVILGLAPYPTFPTYNRLFLPRILLLGSEERLPKTNNNKRRKGLYGTYDNFNFFIVFITINYLHKVCITAKCNNNAKCNTNRKCNTH